jgi:hypothetical protein
MTQLPAWAVERGEVAEALVDRAARRVLRQLCAEVQISEMAGSLGMKERDRERTHAW